MFSQQTIKKMNLGAAMNNINNANSTSTMPNMQNMQYHPQNFYTFQEYSPFPMNDSMSCFSTSTTASSMSNMKKRNMTEELNTILTTCMEEMLPKIAQECAEVVYSQITTELDKQAAEIEDMKVQLETISNLSANNTALNTPVKKIRNMKDHLGQVKKMTKEHNEYLKDQFQKLEQSKFPETIYENLQEKLQLLHEKIEEEKKMAERLNFNLKDRYVDILGIKNFIDEKAGYLMTDMRINPGDYSRKEAEAYHQVINSINKLTEDIERNSKALKKPYSKLEVQNVNSHSNRGYNYQNEMMIDSCNETTPVYLNRNCDVNLPGKKKGGLFQSFRKFTF